MIKVDQVYITSAKILSALELGIPQDRDRFILNWFFVRDLVQEVSTLSTLIGKGNDWFCWPEPIFNKAKDLNWPGISPFGADEINLPEGIPHQLMINDLVQDDAEKIAEWPRYVQPIL